MNRRTPRYTSYPTAVQFGAQVGTSAYEHWLTALPVNEPVSIYIHVPFCAELCLYCGCHTTVARRYPPIAHYAELLEREIALIGGIVGRRRLNHLHFGGGTPTMLAPQDFMRIMDAIRKHFTTASEAELAIEIDPRTLTRGQIAVLSAAGITRASLGVQDFDGRVQQAVRRIQPFEQTARAVDWLRDAGVAGINFDLMYGLPYQTSSTVAATARRAVTLEPDRIAVFGYAHVPWMRRHQKLIPEQALPDDNERFAQNLAASEIFIGSGYEPVGLDHFAKKNDLLVRRQHEGRLHRNFQGYTTDDAKILFGFGISAIGRLPDGYVQNTTNAAAYRNTIANGRPAIVRGRALTAEDRLRGAIIERLMCDLQVDLAALCAAHKRTFNEFSVELSRLAELAEDGLVICAGSKIVVPESMRPFVRIVCSVFDGYLSNDNERYSRAS